MKTTTAQVRELFDHTDAIVAQFLATLVGVGEDRPSALSDAEVIAAVAIAQLGKVARETQNPDLRDQARTLAVDLLNQQTRRQVKPGRGPRPTGPAGTW